MIWYKCDPAKNTGCKKRTCSYNPSATHRVCDRTSNPAYTMLDEANRPMALPELPPRPSLFNKPPGFLAGLIVGFALRFITELIKLFLSGG